MSPLDSGLFKTTIYDVIHSVWRNHPPGVSTFSQCECGLSARRGSEPCLGCLKERLLAKGVSNDLIDKWYKAIKEIRNVESDLVKIVGEGVEL